MQNDSALPAETAAVRPAFQFTLQEMFLFVAGLGGELALLIGYEMPPGMVLFFVALTSLPIWCFARSANLYARITWLLCIFVPQILFLERMARAIDAASRSSCNDHMDDLVIAMQHRAYRSGHLPPAYSADASGKPMHSWRVLILPWLGYQELYDEYKFDEPWDGPNNRKLWYKMPQYYRCTKDPPDSINTNYVAVVGPRTAWPGSSPVKFDEITDGLDKTILLVEMSNSGIIWTEPRDLPFHQLGRQLAGQPALMPRSNHRGGYNVVFADHSIRSYKEPLPLDVLKALLTRNSGENVDPKQWP